MNLRDLKQEMEFFKTSDDNEKLHEKEDELHVEVLREVAKGNPESRKLAKEVLKISKLDFHRWCA